MTSRLNALRIGWGYAMLGPIAWTAMLTSMDAPAPPPTVSMTGVHEPAGPVSVRALSPLLVALAVILIVGSLAVPVLVRRSRWLRAAVLVKTEAPADATAREREKLTKAREARAFEIFLVAWVLSVLLAAFAGMFGLLLSQRGYDHRVSYALFAAAFVLTALRFPSARAVEEAEGGGRSTGLTTG